MYALRFKKVGGPGTRTMMRHPGSRGVPNAQDMWSPLHSAARHGNTKLIGLLLYHGAPEGLATAVRALFVWHVIVGCCGIYLGDTKLIGLLLLYHAAGALP